MLFLFSHVNKVNGHIRHLPWVVYMCKNQYKTLREYKLPSDFFNVLGLYRLIT